MAAAVGGAALALGSGGIPLGGFAAASTMMSAVGTIGTVIKVATVGATLLGAVGGIQGARLASQAAQQTQQARADVSGYNAEIARQNATVARNAASTEALELRTEARKKTSAIRARMAAGGVVTTAGSPLLVQQAQEVEGAFASQRRLFRGEQEAGAFESQAKLDTFRGAISRRNVGIEKQAGDIATASAGFQGLQTLSTVGQSLL